MCPRGTGKQAEGSRCDCEGASEWGRHRLSRVCSAPNTRADRRVGVVVPEECALPDIAREYVGVDLGQLPTLVLRDPRGTCLLDSPVKAGPDAAQGLKVLFDHLFERRRK